MADPKYKKLRECGICGVATESGESTCRVCLGSNFRERFQCQSCRKICPTAWCSDCIPESVDPIPPTWPPAEAAIEPGVPPGFGDREHVEASRVFWQLIRTRTKLGCIAGVRNGVVGSLLGGFFGLVTYRLPEGAYMAASVGLGWFLIGFLWGFGWRSDRHLGNREDDSGIWSLIAVLGVVSFVSCYVGMLVGVMRGGEPTARAVIINIFLLFGTSGLVPGIVLTIGRLLWRDTGRR